MPNSTHVCVELMEVTKDSFKKFFSKEIFYDFVTLYKSLLQVFFFSPIFNLKFIIYIQKQIGKTPNELS